MKCRASLRQTPVASPETVSGSGEKKRIIVLFAGVVGSRIEERLDAEVAQILGRFAP